MYQVQTILGLHQERYYLFVPTRPEEVNQWLLRDIRGLPFQLKKIYEEFNTIPNKKQSKFIEYACLTTFSSIRGGSFVNIIINQQVYTRVN